MPIIWITREICLWLIVSGENYNGVNSTLKNICLFFISRFKMISPDFWSTNLELFKFKDLICIELGIAKILIPAFLWHILKSIGKRFPNKRLKITLWIINYRAYYLWIIKAHKNGKENLKTSISGSLKM